MVTRLDEEDEDEWNRTLRPVALEPSPSRVHSRESSIEKILSATSTASSTASIPPRIHTSASRSALGGVVERAVDPKAAAYGHHRQTSIVHGIQHSRNGSLASSATSPLSPQMIAAAGAGASLTPDRAEMHGFARLEGEPGTVSRPSTAMPGAIEAGGASSASDAGALPPPRAKLERVHSGRSRRDHSQHHSHSSRHKEDQKTVGEYALHVLFTSVGHVASPTPAARPLGTGFLTPL